MVSGRMKIELIIGVTYFIISFKVKKKEFNLTYLNPRKGLKVVQSTIVMDSLHTIKTTSLRVYFF